MAFNSASASPGRPSASTTTSPAISEQSTSRPVSQRYPSESTSFSSPQRHHFRAASSTTPVKETRNARSQYSNSQEDGTSQLRINQYIVRQEIGRGAFGAVHLATDQYGKEYAVKEFSKTRLRRRAKSNLLRRPREGLQSQTPQQQQQQQQSAHRTPSDRPGFRGLLERSFRSHGHLAEEGDNSFDLIKEEIAIMKKLDHPNLVRLIEVLDDPEDDSLFMVLEMCKKGVIMKVELDEKADPYSEEDCRMWFRDLILGIEYLHSQGVVHRDIKPDNCLLTEDDTLKIVDFGVSEMFDKGASSMTIAKSAGSPAFMAPEVCQLAHGDVSGRAADIWSMGVTLYCMRFGEVPFKSHAVMDLYRCIVNDKLTIEERCDDAFKDLMFRILEKDPAKRIKMRELRDHPWVTVNGTDPLLSESENCASLIAPPTEDEMNAAITSNMARVMAVMKAVNRFKNLIEKKRPDLVHSMLGHASKYVKPPHAMSKWDKHYDDHSSSASPGPQSAVPEADVQNAKGMLAKNGDTLGAELAAKIDRLPKALKHSVLADTGSEPRSSPPPPSAQENRPQRPQSSATMPLPSDSTDDDLLKTIADRRARVHARDAQTLPGKGQAHDPLEDHLFLRIGPGPRSRMTDRGKDKKIDAPEAVPEAEEAEDEGPFAVCESPGATNFNVYERAYEEEVAMIRRQRGRESNIYLTRRVGSRLQGKVDQLGWADADSSTYRGYAKTSMASMVGRAVGKAGEFAERAAEKGRVKDEAKRGSHEDEQS